MTVLAVYMVVVSAIDASLFQNLQGQVDARISARLTQIEERPPLIGGPPPRGERDQPIYTWLIGPDGKVAGYYTAAPAVPDGFHPGSPTTVELEGSRFRVAGHEFRGGWLVVGQGIDDVYQATSALVVIEALLALPLATLTFLGALWVARRSVAPVEDARRRQLAFTADASHELRTPLTVIEAEAGLAMLKPRTEAYYRDAMERIIAEGARLRRIVEDLLWLARFESEPTAPAAERVDVGDAAGETVARFQPVASSQATRLSIAVSGKQAPVIEAPTEWIDRLIGVLVDNACRYSPQGVVHVSVVTGDGRVRLSVEDSGPGIPQAERQHIFERFHRATTQSGGHGLGLAIGDSVVKGTGGTWQISESAAGGAQMAVSWPLAKGGPQRDREAAHSDSALPDQGRAPAT
jgi:signal transduction histidine kinase